MSDDAFSRDTAPAPGSDLGRARQAMEGTDPVTVRTLPDGVGFCPEPRFFADAPRGRRRLVRLARTGVAVYEREEGTPLQVVIEACRARGLPLGRERLRMLLLPLARAVDALDVPHGLLHPERVLVCADGPLLVEWGWWSCAGRPRLLAYECMRGRSDALAPELWSPSTPTRAADVFGVAQIATRLVALEPPGFRAWQVVGHRVAQVLAWGLDPDPSRRPPDAESFVRRLLDVVGHELEFEDEGPTRSVDTPAVGSSELQALERLGAAEVPIRPGPTPLDIAELGVCGALTVAGWGVWTWLS